jgi:SAM-dependent methyltransferase
MCLAMTETVEAVRAKDFWGSTDKQGKEYPTPPPFYAAALTHVIRRIAPARVLEMGCNTGRNLALLRQHLPAGTGLRGFDINPRSIEYGKRAWGLDLDLADEGYLRRILPGAVDVVFTVSVLDHLPAIDEVVADLARITRGHLITVEPHPEPDLRYLEVFKADKRIRTSVDTTTPYSYLHPYPDVVPRCGLRPVLDVPMPPYATNWGPLYRLTVWAQPGVPAAVPWEQVRDELMFAAVAQSLKI